MRKIFFLSGIFFCISSIAFAQGPAMSVFAELGGPGLASINFDTRFTKTEGGFGGRAGIGGFSIKDEVSNSSVGVVFVPLGVNYLIGKDHRNYLEVGAGITPVILTGDFSDDSKTFSTTFGHLVFGYRMQPENGGFTFRAFVCPVFGSGFFVPYYGGISFGYKFGGGRR